jgi:protein-S-isoprenylcysteine O-methyltransferase Ste14
MTEDKAEFLLVFLVLSGLILLRDALTSLWRRRGNAGGGADQELYFLIAVSGFCMVVIPTIDALVPWLEFADFTFRSDIAWAGLVVGLLAVWLCRRALLDRAARRSGGVVPAGRSGFVVRGIYLYIRHPFYSALLLLALAQVLLIQNWLGAVAAILGFALVYGLRVPRDDMAALERFGDNYLDYMSSTGSLVPRLFSSRRQD